MVAMQQKRRPWRAGEDVYQRRRDLLASAAQSGSPVCAHSRGRPAEIHAAAPARTVTKMPKADARRTEHVSAMRRM